MVSAQVPTPPCTDKPRGASLQPDDSIPTAGDIGTLLELYGVTGPERDGLVQLTQDARQPGWWHSFRDVLPNPYEVYIGLEAGAASIRNRGHELAARVVLDTNTVQCSSRPAVDHPARVIGHVSWRVSSDGPRYGQRMRLLVVRVSRVVLSAGVLWVGRSFSWQLIGGIRNLVMMTVRPGRRHGMTSYMPRRMTRQSGRGRYGCWSTWRRSGGLREQPVRDVAEYQDRRWWAGDIPAHPSCVLTATGAEPWLTVSKAQVPPGSGEPDDIAAHLRTGVTDPADEPAFGADFDDRFADDPAEAARLRDDSRIRRGAVAGLGSRGPDGLGARKLYEDLFELRLRLQRESALIELVWGHGILSWAVDGTRIVHPLVTTQVQLSFDPGTGAISVEPEALIPHLEIDLLQGLG